MCDHTNDPGGREAAMTVVVRDESGTPTAWCDPCIAPVVAALNAGGVRTVASCCGHGKNDPSIALADGRWVTITHEAPTPYGHRREQAREQALVDAFWAVHAGRFHGRDSEYGVDTFYAGTNAAKRAIENLRGTSIIRPWGREDEHRD
jgi:hypothetical protein